MELQTPTIPVLNANLDFSGPITDIFARFSLDSLSFFSGGITIPPQVVWLLFWVSLALFATTSLVLFFHWENFEFDKIIVRWMTLVYTIGGITVLIAIFSSISVYTASL